jgi:hypothetical protein
MRGAQPTFQVYSPTDYDGVGPKPSGRDGSGVMHPASELAVREVHYRDDIVDIDNPDAQWIAAADPTTILALIDRCRRAETALQEIRTAAAWRDDLDPKERLRMCLVAARAALEGGSE